MCETHLIIVVAQGSAQLIVIHVGLVLAQPPELCYLFGLEQLELAVVGRPADEVLVTLVEQQLQQELPERDGALHDGRRPRDNGRSAVANRNVSSKLHNVDRIFQS